MATWGTGLSVDVVSMLLELKVLLREYLIHKDVRDFTSEHDEELIAGRLCE